MSQKSLEELFFNDPVVLSPIERCVKTILKYRESGFWLDNELHYNGLPNYNDSSHGNMGWIGSNDNQIVLSILDNYPEFTEDEISGLVKEVQGNFVYPKQPREIRFYQADNSKCGLCKQFCYIYPEVLLIWKNNEIRINQTVCTSCFDRLQNMFGGRGWEELTMKRIEVKTKRNPINSILRHECFKRDNYRCKECGADNNKTTLHVDHIIPVSQGGSDELDNLQTLCQECNFAKHNRMWEAGK